MLRRTIVRSLTAVLTVALVLTGSALGLTGAATATPARAIAPAAAADEVPVQARVQQLADALTEGLKLHMRDTRHRNRLWEHGPSPSPGTARIVIHLKSGALLGTNDVQFTEPSGDAHQLYLSLPNARKLLKHRKHPVLVADVTFYDARGPMYTASSRVRL